MGTRVKRVNGGREWLDDAATEGAGTARGREVGVKSMVGAIARRVVVVDDDESVCRALARVLRSFGFEVQTFGSASDLLATGLPDDTFCLVADVRMPEMDGIELCEQLHASGRDVPTVFVTAHEIERRSSPVLHGAEILSKPVGADRLVEAIATVRKRWNVCRGRR